MASMTNSEAMTNMFINSSRLPYKAIEKIVKVCEILHRHKKISTKYFEHISLIINFESRSPSGDHTLQGSYHDLHFISEVLNFKKENSNFLITLINNYGFNTDRFEILAIGIYLHGGIKTDDTGRPIKNNNYPDGIYMRKKNISDFGCVAFSSKFVEHALPAHIVKLYPSGQIALTVKALTSLESCVNTDTYLRVVQGYKDMSTLHKNGCSILHEGKTEYYEKIYQSDKTPIHSQLIFMINPSVYINIMSCSLKEFIHFFSQNGLTPYKVTKLEHVFNKISEKRSIMLTTTDLHELISYAQEYLSIKNVNILDTSCSVISSLTDDPSDQCSACPGFSISCNGFKPEPNLAWGGKTRRKRTRSKKRLVK